VHAHQTVYRRTWPIGVVVAVARWSPSELIRIERLDGELYRLRREGTLTQQQVARELKCSASKLIRIEVVVVIPLSRPSNECP